MPKKHERAWQRMLSGRRLDLINPSPIDIEIEDIAHGLARLARWNGQTKGNHAFSVAEHSVFVEQIAGKLQPNLETSFKMAALLHDAAEYVIGDMISPFKTALGLDYKAFEDQLEQAIYIRFGIKPKLSHKIRNLIKKADMICAYFEATQIAGFTFTEAQKYFLKPPPNIHLKIEPLSVIESQRLFLERFKALSANLSDKNRL